MSSDPRAIQELFATAALGPPESAIGFVLWRLVHRYQREADRALAPLDLTQLQFMTLIMAAWLARSGEEVTQSEIARAGDIHPMQVSQVLKTLEAKGMVSRQRSASDVRAKHVGVTAAGLEALRDALPLAIDVQQRLFGDEGRPGGSLLAALLRLGDKG